ncbi:hypothetical protein THAOC_25991, partial [Thalassiosira oceanica]
PRAAARAWAASGGEAGQYKEVRRPGPGLGAVPAGGESTLGRTGTLREVAREATRDWLALAGRRGHPDAVYNLAILDYDAEEDEDERASPPTASRGRPTWAAPAPPSAWPAAASLPRKEVGGHGPLRHDSGGAAH